MTADWSTPEGLAQIKAALAATIDGWRSPVAYGVGISPASSSPEFEFPHVNPPGGTHGLPCVILAAVVGHAHGSATYQLSSQQLAQAVHTLEPAEDLDVPESESEEVKGGLSLNYSKIELSYKAQKVSPTDQIPTDQKWAG